MIKNRTHLRNLLLIALCVGNIDPKAMVCQAFRDEPRTFVIGEIEGGALDVATAMLRGSGDSSLSCASSAKYSC